MNARQAQSLLSLIADLYTLIQVGDPPNAPQPVDSVQAEDTDT